MLSHLYWDMTDELPFILYLADIVFDVDWCYVDLILDWCYVHWLMLMPFYITIGVIRLRADVIALFGYGRCYCQVADGIATGWTILFLVGRCYSHVSDVITTGWIYFNFSSELFNRTSSHIWGKWYVKYLSDWMILKFLHKLSYNYWNTWIWQI